MERVRRENESGEGEARQRVSGEVEERVSWWGG